MIAANVVFVRLFGRGGAKQFLGVPQASCDYVPATVPAVCG